VVTQHYDTLQAVYSTALFDGYYHQQWLCKHNMVSFSRLWSVNNEKVKEKLKQKLKRHSNRKSRGRGF
jgi:hypothetical protein